MNKHYDLSDYPETEQPAVSGQIEHVVSRNSEDIYRWINDIHSDGSDWIEKNGKFIYPHNLVKDIHKLQIRIRELEKSC
jgi:hypothetical protein